MGSANCLLTPVPVGPFTTTEASIFVPTRDRSPLRRAVYGVYFLSLPRRQSEPSCRKPSKLYADAYGLGLDSDTHCSWYRPVTNCYNRWSRSLLRPCREVVERLKWKYAQISCILIAAQITESPYRDFLWNAGVCYQAIASAVPGMQLGGQTATSPPAQPWDCRILILSRQVQLSRTVDSQVSVLRLGPM
jgi:hypothetical protein